MLLLTQSQQAQHNTSLQLPTCKHCKNLFLMLCITTFVGEKIGELTHEKIKESIDNENLIHDITVRGGKMVLACREAGVMLFNMN